MGDDLAYAFSKQGRKKQIVGQAEILTVLFARQLSNKEITGRSVMYYIDTDSARYGLTRGLSDEPTSMTMMAQFGDQDSLATTNPWFARAPVMPTLLTNLAGGKHP